MLDFNTKIMINTIKYENQDFFDKKIYKRKSFNENVILQYIEKISPYFVIKYTRKYHPEYITEKVITSIIKEIFNRNYMIKNKSIRFKYSMVLEEICKLYNAEQYKFLILEESFKNQIYIGDIGFYISFYNFISEITLEHLSYLIKNYNNVFFNFIPFEKLYTLYYNKNIPDDFCFTHLKEHFENYVHSAGLNYSIDFHISQDYIRKNICSFSIDMLYFLLNNIHLKNIDEKTKNMIVERISK